MSRKYKFGEKTGAYFISFATVYWIDVFTRDEYFGSIVESLDYCRKNKGMEIYRYCIMPSHVHLIFRSENGDPSGLVRDFKGFTSRKMLKAIEENPQESRKEWMLWMFERAGTKYRMGAAYFGYKDYKIGTNSEWIRHAIQNDVIKNKPLESNKNAERFDYYINIIFLIPIFS